MKSILGSTKEKCFICGSPHTECHHIYRGANRQASDKHGFIVYLCREHHTGKWSVHNKKEIDATLKVACQKAFERNHSREEFMKIIGKNYL